MREGEGVQKGKDSITMWGERGKKPLCNQELEHLYKFERYIQEHTILGFDRGVFFFSACSSQSFLH